MLVSKDDPYTLATVVVQHMGVGPGAHTYLAQVLVIVAPGECGLIEES